MKFYYEAFTTKGEPTAGELEARDESAAAEQLRDEMGLIAREISQEPIRLRYDHSKSKSGPLTEGVAKKAGTGQAPKGDKPAIRPPAQKTQKGSTGNSTGSIFSSLLRLRLNRISEVARQMDEWEKVYQECRKEEKKLPPSCPNMGGQSWKAYNSFKTKIVADMIHKAMEEASGMGQE